ncbi:hypothetical protein GQ43DRAFT_441366 [Delitschia confertaspora ATCC 74209]|uniref:Uncharacterized protein n=1 Tax=Delitschia confertaspora ATCC 74209 TaxID=1513339 RepID=A0A9P4JJL4_9PLEO|nr:hypothetical protein GQ43DRAFT_441366 [Delitschia confertaspora ATCC 74209]
MSAVTFLKAFCNINEDEKLAVDNGPCLARVLNSVPTRSVVRAKRFRKLTKQEEVEGNSDQDEVSEPGDNTEPAKNAEEEEDPDREEDPDCEEDPDREEDSDYEEA